MQIFELQSTNIICKHKTKECYLKWLPIPPQHVSVDPETGIETLRWDCRVHRRMAVDKEDGYAYWYSGYYAD
ncbi:MAG: hypothetical protein LBM64_02325, partial [Deltaproteobacteria bacterium]|nr:hypothetical protein [Deltaproteobacteria bacterium]